MIQRLELIEALNRIRIYLHATRRKKFTWATHLGTESSQVALGAGLASSRLPSLFQPGRAGPFSEPCRCFPILGLLELLRLNAPRLTPHDAHSQST